MPAHKPTKTAKKKPTMRPAHVCAITEDHLHAAVSASYRNGLNVGKETERGLIIHRCLVMIGAQKRELENRAWYMMTTSSRIDQCDKIEAEILKLKGEGE
jgi:hypothetical protein